MSQTARTIIKNTAWLGLAEVVGGLLNFFPTVWIARYLGSTQYGMLSFAITLAALFALVVDFGFGLLTTREVARDRSQASKYLNNVLTLRLVLSGVYILLLVAIGWISGREPIIIKLILLLAVSTVMNNLTQSFTAVFRGYERMEYEAFGRVLLSVVLAGLGFYLVITKGQLILFGWLYVASSLASLLFVAGVARAKFTKFTLSVSRDFWKYLVRESWPFVLSMAFISVYYYMDSVMLGFMKQDTAVGWYNADYKIILFIHMVVGILFSSFFPLIARLYKESIEQLRDLLKDFSKLVTSLAVPLGVGGMVLARPIIELLFGRDYVGGIPAMQILIWAAALSFMNIAFGNPLLGCDRQKIYVRGVGLGAGVNFVLNFLLIPRFSLNGAATATLLAELIVLVYMYIHIRRVVMVPLFPYLPRVLTATVAMLIPLITLTRLPVLLVILIAAVTYVAVLLAVGGISKHDLAILRSVATRKAVVSDT